jgi:PAS domain S-box-containing protein
MTIASQTSDPQQRDPAVEARASQVMASFGNVPVPLCLADSPQMRVRATNAPLEKLTGLTSDELLGWNILDFVPPERRATVRSDQLAIADGRLEGFQAGRIFHLPNGRTIQATVWARRLVVEDEVWGLGVVLPVDAGHVQPHPGFTGADVDSVMTVTDHDWVIQHASADARRVLGTDPTDLIGQPLLGLIHPGDSGGFVTTVSAAAASNTTMMCSARLRGGDRQWHNLTCYVSALCDHAPPRIGLAASRPVDSPGAPEQAGRRELEQVVWRIAMELRAAGVISEEPTAITNGPPQRAAQLSSRQWEIVQRLLRGQDAARIASEIYLSPSTVRNHLVAVYRKFGVHSQVQLLSLLHDERRDSSASCTPLSGEEAEAD